LELNGQCYFLGQYEAFWICPLLTIIAASIIRELYRILMLT